MNDYHHAKDAYLNIVVGNAFYTKFTSNPIHFLSEKNAVYSLNERTFINFPYKEDQLWHGNRAIAVRWQLSGNGWIRITFYIHGCLLRRKGIV